MLLRSSRYSGYNLTQLSLPLHLIVNQIPTPVGHYPYNTLRRVSPRLRHAPLLPPPIAPTRFNMDDFWSVVWHEDIACIVMLSELFEHARVRFRITQVITSWGHVSNRGVTYQIMGSRIKSWSHVSN